MITENLSSLKIHKLTQKQYEKALEDGKINENELYLTPDEKIDLEIYATKDYVDEEIATMVGNIEAALDNILTLQNDYIGGDA